MFSEIHRMIQQIEYTTESVMEVTVVIHAKAPPQQGRPPFMVIDTVSDLLGRDRSEMEALFP